MAILQDLLEGEGAKLEQGWPETRPRHGSIAMPQLFCQCNRPLGKFMDSGVNAVPSEALKTGKALVGDQKAERQAVPRGSALNWTEILAKNGLESPGYRETIDKMKAEGRIKK